jgi:hypothetical protein
MATAAYTGQSYYSSAGLIEALASDPAWLLAIGASGSGSGTGSAVSFSLTVPVTSGTESTGDTVYVTTNGASTGVVLAEYRFVAAAGGWVEIPLGVQWSNSNW